MSQETAISLLLAQHAMHQESRPEPPKVTVTMSPLPSPKVKAKREQPTTPKPLTATVVGLAGVERGTLDAAGFMAAIRTAGKRTNEAGRPIHQPGEVRGDMIKAIHAYVGYDPRGDFGSQEQAARAKAQRELQPGKVTTGPSLAEQRSAGRSLTGYVAGMPEIQKAKLVELQARETYTVEEILDLEKEIAALPKDSRAAVAKGVELNRLRCLLSNVQDSLRQFGG